jgi:hypothetical protein
MAAYRISVRRVLELGVPVTWQEAVAVVHEVAILSVVNATRNGVPSRINADSCILTRRGDVELPQTTDQERPDAALQLLRDLITGRETPTDLEALAYGAPTRTLTDDLAMFSRPNRRSEIANLAMRALDAEQEMARLGITPPALVDGLPPAVAPPPLPADPAAPAVAPPAAEADLAWLRDQMAARPAAAVEPPPPPAPPARRAPPWAMRAAAALLLATGTAVVWWTWSVSPPAPPEAPAGAAIPAGLGPVALDPSWHTAGRREADIDLGQPAAPARTAAGRDASSPPFGRARSGDLMASNAVGRDSTAAALTDAAVTAAIDTAAADAELDALFADDSVYSVSHAAVRPPMMLFPRLPRAAFPGPTDRIDGAYFEVLVDQRGGVEAVRLRGREQPGQTFYRARMMLSAAKVWQFQPAQLDGRPVRYVVRVVPEP